MSNPWMIFVITLIVGAVFVGIDQRCTGVTDCPRTLLHALQDWRTFLGVIVALLCAGGAIRIVHWESNQDLRAARARRDRISRAFRAEMPVHLARLEIYAKDSIAICARVLEEAKADRSGDEQAGEPERVSCPELPAPTSERLRQPIEDLETNIAEPIAALLACYDVQHARLEELVELLNVPDRNGDTLLGEHHAELPLRTTIELYLRSTRLFPFARREVDLVEPLKLDYAAINIALIELGVSERLSPYGRERLLARFGMAAECRRPPI